MPKVENNLNINYLVYVYAPELFIRVHTFFLLLHYFHPWIAQIHEGHIHDIVFSWSICRVLKGSTLHRHTTTRHQCIQRVSLTTFKDIEMLTR